MGCVEEFKIMYRFWSHFLSHRQFLRAVAKIGQGQT
jgi:hypothetical protein